MKKSRIASRVPHQNRPCVICVWCEGRRQYAMLSRRCVPVTDSSGWRSLRIPTDRVAVNRAAAECAVTAGHYGTVQQSPESAGLGVFHRALSPWPCSLNAATNSGPAALGFTGSPTRIVPRCTSALSARQPADAHARLDCQPGTMYVSLGNRGYMSKPTDLVQGTLDLLLLKIVALAVTWLGDRSASKTGIRRRIAGQRRITLSRAAQARARRVDHREVAACGDRPAGQVLLPFPCRPTSP